MHRLFLVLIALLPAGAGAETPNDAFYRLLQRAEAAPGVQRLLGTLGALVPGTAESGKPNPSFYLVNRSDQEIDEIYVSPTTDRGWGEDFLGDDILDADDYVGIRLLAGGACTYDLRVVYEDGSKEDRRGVNTCAVDDVVFGLPPPSAARARNDPSFRIVNHGDRDIYSVYARPAGTRRWGRDRLGDNTIDADSNRVIHMPTGQCLWDVRIVFEDNHATEKPRLNLCAIMDLPVR